MPTTQKEDILFVLEPPFSRLFTIFLLSTILLVVLLSIQYFYHVAEIGSLIGIGLIISIIVWCLLAESFVKVTVHSNSFNVSYTVRPFAKSYYYYVNEIERIEIISRTYSVIYIYYANKKKAHPVRNLTAKELERLANELDSIGLDVIYRY